MAVYHPLTLTKIHLRDIVLQCLSLPIFLLPPCHLTSHRCSLPRGRVINGQVSVMVTAKTGSGLVDSLPEVFFHVSHELHSICSSPPYLPYPQAARSGELNVVAVMESDGERHR